MISATTIDHVLERMSDQTPEQAQALVLQMSEEQPNVLAFLTVMSEYEGFNRLERQLFCYIGIIIWQILEQRPGGCKSVSNEHLKQIYQANKDFFAKVASDSAGDFVGGLLSMIENYPEPEVLRYVTVVLKDDPQDAPSSMDMRRENLDFAFLHLKTIVDSLI